MIEIVLDAAVDTPEEAAARFLAVAEAVQPAGGLEAQMWAALLQLQRFVSSNIEIDTARTLNSLTAQISQVANTVVGTLGTNVSYGPYVRDKTHSMGFLEYAEQNEIPNIIEWWGENMTVVIEDAFNK